MRNKVRALSSILALLSVLCAETASAQVGLRGANAVSSQAALTNSAVTVKGSTGIVSVLSCNNPSNAVAFVQFFDTIGAVVVGSTAPKFWAALPIGATSVTFGVNMFAGIKMAAATTATGGSAPSSALQCSVMFQ